MSAIPMSMDERTELQILQQKSAAGTITPTEQTRKQELEDTFQCDD